MQFLIDTDTESAAGLQMAAKVLLLIASGLKTDGPIEAWSPEDIQNAKPTPPTPPQPIVTPAAPCSPVPLPPNNVPPAPVVHPSIHPDAEVPAGTPDPAKLFAGNTLPFVPPSAPLAAPAPPAPGAAPAVSTGAPESLGPQSQTGERDKAGIPWDARIHSETKKQNADGTWRFRRNLDESVKATVMAELRLGHAPTPVANVVPPPPPPPPAPAAPPPPPATSVVPPPPVSLPPAVDVGVPNPPGPAMVQVVTGFREFMTLVNKSLAAGTLNQAQLADGCKLEGVDSVTGLVAQPLLIPKVHARLAPFLIAA